MNVRTAEPAAEKAAPPLEDRVYARAFALTVRREPSDAAITELIELAGGNPHLLGHARRRLVDLVAEHVDSAHVERALALVTCAWLTAIAAA